MNNEKINPSSIFTDVQHVTANNLSVIPRYSYYDSELRTLFQGEMHPDGTAEVRVVDDIDRLEIERKTIVLTPKHSVRDAELAREALAIALAPVISDIRRRPTTNQGILF